MYIFMYAYIYIYVLFTHTYRYMTNNMLYILGQGKIPWNLAYSHIPYRHLVSWMDGQKVLHL